MTFVHMKFDLKTNHDGKGPAKIVKFRSLREAITSLRQTCSHDHGLGLFSAPKLSGKMTAIRSFVEQLPEDYLVAVVDGANLDVQDFLLAILRGFGFELETSSSNELINLIKVIAVQQTSTNKAPLLVISNLNMMKPEALHTVCQLATYTVGSQSALRLVLVSDEPFESMISARELGIIRSRKTSEHEFGPMTRAETAYYIDAKLRHAGVRRPEAIFSAHMADEVYDESGGRPGLVDQCVLRRIPASRERARIILTRNGETLAIVALAKPKILIGRAETNDVVINSKFVSRHHIMVTHEIGATVLTDLNSTNGTCVNSMPVNACGLRHQDVISFGDFRIKLMDPGSVPRASIADLSMEDTATMRTLDDNRRRYARDTMKAQVAETS